MGINQDMAHIAAFASASLYAPLQHLHSLARRRMDRWQLARMGRDTARVVAMATPFNRRAQGATEAALQGSMGQQPTGTAPTIGLTSSEWAGRVVISGRMADVCAELARLAALEAAEHHDARH